MQKLAGIKHFFTRKFESSFLIRMLSVVQGHTQAGTHLHKVTQTMFATCTCWHKNWSAHQQKNTSFKAQANWNPIVLVSVSYLLTHTHAHAHAGTIMPKTRILHVPLQRVCVADLLRFARSCSSQMQPLLQRCVYKLCLYMFSFDSSHLYENVSCCLVILSIHIEFRQKSVRQKVKK